MELFFKDDLEHDIKKTTAFKVFLSVCALSFLRDEEIEKKSFGVIKINDLALWKTLHDSYEL